MSGCVETTKDNAGTRFPETLTFTGLAKKYFRIALSGNMTSIKRRFLCVTRTKHYFSLLTKLEMRRSCAFAGPGNLPGARFAYEYDGWFDNLPFEYDSFDPHDSPLYDYSPIVEQYYPGPGCEFFDMENKDLPLLVYRADYPGARPTPEAGVLLIDFLHFDHRLRGVDGFHGPIFICGREKDGQPTRLSVPVYMTLKLVEESIQNSGIDWAVYERESMRALEDPTVPPPRVSKELLGRFIMCTAALRGLIGEPETVQPAARKKRRVSTR